MLSLILVAVHFAMQVYAQQEANRLVRIWSEQHGVSIGDVRYRMLRGALTLVDVRYKGKELQLYASSLFLRGNLDSLSSNNPKASYVEIRGADVSMTSAAFMAIMDQKRSVMPELFEQLWRSAQRVGIYHTRLQMLPDIAIPLPAKPVEGFLTQFESSDVGDVRELKALASWQGGELTLVTRNELVDGVSRFTKGELRWNDLNAELLLRDLLGFAPVSGTANGRVIWNRQTDTSHVYDLQGLLNIAMAGGGVSPASIGWKGTVTDGAWQVDVSSVAWPVNIFSNYLPSFQGRRLTAGRFDGEFRLAGILEHWQLDIAKSTLSDLRCDRQGEGEAVPSGWRAEKVVLKGGTLQWPKRSIIIEQAELTGGDVVIDARGMEAEELQWEFSLGKMAIADLRTVIRLSEERVHLPPLNGELKRGKGGDLSLNLASPESPDMGEVERWYISGSGNPTATGSERLMFDVEASRASLARFRPFMPYMIRNSATDLTGGVDLQLKVLAGIESWEARGRVVVTDAAFRNGGELWALEQGNVEIGRMGVGLGIQEIEGIAVDGWHYQVALRPLQRPGVQGDVQMRVSKADPWEIRKLELNHGTISVGQPDARWLHDISIHVGEVRFGKAIPVRLAAVAGGGSISLKGNLSWEEAVPTLQDAKVTVRDVLPFFMNEWLSVSSLPQIIRGRLYADIAVRAKADREYSGMGYFRLQHSLLASAILQDDLLLSQVGFNTFDVFNTLQQSGRLRMRVPVEGHGGLAEVLGNSMLRVVKTEMQKKQIAQSSNVISDNLLSSIRLHAEKSLSQNERVRLRKAIKHMLDKPKTAIELRPQLSLEMDGDDQIRRVRHTQELIETFMVQRGIPASRIFPIWPHEQLKRSGSTSGIGIYELR